jgi:hypothetical protein
MLTPSFVKRILISRHKDTVKMSREGADVIAMHICLASRFRKNPAVDVKKVTVINHQ